MMNILISVNRFYLDKAETMLHSLSRHSSEDITVYLMNHSLNSAEIKQFRKYLQEHLEMNLEVIDISATVFDQLPLGNGRFSIEIYYRVLAQFLLPETVNRILWLDADMVLCGDISEFYHQDFEGNLLAACADSACDGAEVVRIKESLGLPKEHIYFNSGVLLLNIEALRDNTDPQEIAQTAQVIAKHFIYPDQDLLNYLYSGRIKYCDPQKYNCLAKDIGEGNQMNDIVILHYAGTQKPWLPYYLYELSKAAIPYWREIASQGKWFSIIKIAVLYMAWQVYYKTGICNIVRKEMSKRK